MKKIYGLLVAVIVSLLISGCSHLNFVLHQDDIQIDVTQGLIDNLTRGDKEYFYSNMVLENINSDDLEKQLENAFDLFKGKQVSSKYFVFHSYEHNYHNKSSVDYISEAWKTEDILFDDGSSYVFDVIYSEEKDRESNLDKITITNTQTEESLSIGNYVEKVDYIAVKRPTSTLSYIVKEKDFDSYSDYLLYYLFSEQKDSFYSMLGFELTPVDKKILEDFITVNSKVERGSICHKTLKETMDDNKIEVLSGKGLIYDILVGDTMYQIIYESDYITPAKEGIYGIQIQKVEPEINSFGGHTVLESIYLS